MTNALRGYCKDVLQKISKDAVRQSIRADIDKVNFDKRVEATEKKLRYIRNKYLAHHDKTQHMLPPDKRTGDEITYGEMKKMLNAAYELFNILSFEVQFSPWFDILNDHLRDTQQTGIDKLLELVAKNSVLLNLPETNLSAWERRRLTLNATDLKKVNEYRRKVGLSEA